MSYTTRDTITAGMIAMAKAWLKFFTRDTRNNGDEFVHATDGAPGVLEDAIHSAHGDMLPDDHKYEMIRSALSFIKDDCSDGDKPSDKAHEFADAEVSIYNHDRYMWLASHSARASYVDDAKAELGEASDISGQIAYGWYAEAQEVFYSMLESLRENAENEDESDETVTEDDQGHWHPVSGNPFSKPVKRGKKS